MTRLEVLKTYKIYIGGKFPRTESVRYYTPRNAQGIVLGNICLSSRKDVRNAVVAARKAQGDWSERAAFNRAQIMYRIAEMLEGRKQKFVDEILLQGSSRKDAEAEVACSIDRLIYYAGWCDKYTQVLSSVNPVASSHFNFSVHEATGVVGLAVDVKSSLLGLVSLMAPVIAGGNSCVILASEDLPLCAITFAEVLNSSDVPGGVVNILTGKLSEMLPTLVQHMDVNALAYAGEDVKIRMELEAESIGNMKRIRSYARDWSKADAQDLYLIADFQELKTTWHPIENIGGVTSSY